MNSRVRPSDAEIAALCNGLYDYPGFASIAWDRLEQPVEDNGICWALKRLDTVDVIVLRGSTTRQDWMRDFEAVANPFTHFALGPVHPGFLAGMENAYAAMKSGLRDDVIVCGHSLGAARAGVLTGLMVLDGRAPVARVVFGEPRPGFAAFAQLIASVPARSYRNGNDVLYDLVTDLPIALGPENYVHPCPLTQVCEEPGSDWTQQWGVFAWHAMPLYLAALEKRKGVREHAAAAASVPHLPLH
jgi:hypothetical protein